MSTKLPTPDKPVLIVGDQVTNSFTFAKGTVKATRTEYDGYNYLVDWKAADGEVRTLWCKLEALQLL